MPHIYMILDETLLWQLTPEEPVKKINSEMPKLIIPNNS